MRGGVILIVVGLLLAYIGVTGRYKCFTSAFDCLMGDGSPCDCNDGKMPESVSLNSGSGGGIGTFPTIAPLQPIRPIGATRYV